MDMVSAGFKIYSEQTAEAQKVDMWMVFIFQIWILEVGVRDVCKGFWGLGGPSPPFGPLKIRGPRSGGPGGAPMRCFQVIYQGTGNPAFARKRAENRPLYCCATN